MFTSRPVVTGNLIQGDQASFYGADRSDMLGCCFEDGSHIVAKHCVGTILLDDFCGAIPGSLVGNHFPHHDPLSSFIRTPVWSLTT